MIQLAAGNNAAILRWMAARFPQCPKEAHAIGVLDGDLIAAVAYSGLYSSHGKPVNINMSIVADTPRWAQRWVIKALFRYPFEQIGVQRVTATVAKRNARSRKLVKGMGFTHEGTLRRGWDGRQSALVYGMLRDECRWL